MKNNNRFRVILVLVLGLVSINANAALISRLGAQAYYDTVLNITWLADANYAQTSGYDADGLMTWADANTWAAGLTIAGVSGWSLPTTNPVNGTAFNYYGTSMNGSTDLGYNVSAPGTVYAGSTGSEMAHLFYNTLNNKGGCDPATSTLNSCVVPASYGLTNTGPFSNFQSAYYWSGTEYEANRGDAWFFGFNNGVQDETNESVNYYAWAVRPGDVAAVPLPTAFWLFGSGMIGILGFMRRRKS